MKLRKVAPNLIKVPAARVTAQFDPETWEQFQSSIKQMGPIAPIICSEIDGEIVLVDGLHRLAEAQKNGIKTIDVALIEGDMVDVLTKNIFIDHLRGKTPPSEMVKVIGVLWKEYNLDSEQIAARTGLSRDYIEKLQKISELTPMCRQALDDDRIKVSHAAALTRLNDPVRQEMVLQQQLLYRWSVKDLEDHIVNILALIEETPPGASPLVERPPAKIKCFYCHEEYDIAQISNPNTCVECAGVLLVAMSQARREQSSTQVSKSEP